MEKIEWDILIKYCDVCAEKNIYPIEEIQEKGSCQLCGRIDLVTIITQVSIVDCKDFNWDTWKGGGFTVDQAIPFPTSQNRETIHPTLTYKLLNKRCALYFDKDIVILANPDTGQQIRIRF